MHDSNYHADANRVRHGLTHRVRVVLAAAAIAANLTVTCVRALLGEERLRILLLALPRPH